MQKSRSGIVAANWKMNVLPSEAFDLIRQYGMELNQSFPKVIICAPFTHLNILAPARNWGYYLGAQNCSAEKMGAFTGEISAEMLVDLGCSFVIIGHSEARQRNPGENQQIQAKMRRALDCGLRVIYCCGEPLDMRIANQEFNWVESQFQNDWVHISAADLKAIVIAYEPIWAIGTGHHASPEQAQTMHAFIRGRLGEWFGQLSEELRILYGGSVTASNAVELSRMRDIDGVLVGGSSLKPNEFKSICESFIQTS